MSPNPVRPGRPLDEADRVVRLALISDYARYWADQTPTADAAICGTIRWTYPDLADRVDRCAQGLLRAGIKAGDRVATLSPPHPDFYVTFLATASIGAIWVGLNPRYQFRELDYVVSDAAPRLIFARPTIQDRSYRQELESLANHPSVEQLVLLDGRPEPAHQSFPEFIAQGATVSRAALAEARSLVRPTDPCLIVYTSGTTGTPKGALISHHGLVHVARVQHSIWRVNPLRMINNLPINHIGCVGDVTCDTLVPGGTLVFQEQFDPEEMLRLVAAERISVFGHVPTALQLIVSAPSFRTTDFSTVQLILWEGAAAPVDLIETLRTVCPELANAYGMTETVGSVTFTFDADETEVLANSIGWPVPEYGVRIATANGDPVAPGEPGEIHVKGDFVTLGYWQRPEATRELFTEDGWLRTGDLAEERLDGAYRLIGRLKEMFKSGGYNVYPREVEQVLESHPEVAMAAVIGVADPLYQEVGHAFLLVPSGRQIPEQELLAHCRSQLANYKIPKQFTMATVFPLLPIGKIDKQALRASPR